MLASHSLTHSFKDYLLLKLTSRKKAKNLQPTYHMEALFGDPFGWYVAAVVTLFSMEGK
ncbi:unnamed protein product [Sphenostylis stenocarpa]|uniref:Uncharacterized protein n=1 Tax=Sphenostylis stenocarpa TaxID=92480 RepID=A0AA86VZN9_9FABA|nr:unnamed protein product [Sphenostylis stenocarpa]